MRLIPPTLADWQRAQRAQAVLNGHRIEFFRSFGGRELALFYRDDVLVTTHEWKDRTDSAAAAEQWLSDNDIRGNVQ